MREAAQWRRSQGISMEGDDELLAEPEIIVAPKREEWMTTLPPERKEKYVQFVLKNSSGSDDATTSEPSVNNMALWLEATGGAKQGKVLGMGSLSRTCRISGSSSSTQTQVRTELIPMNQELSHLKEQLAQKDNELQAMRAELRGRDNEFEEFRAQQRFIMQHLQLVSASSPIPLFNLLQMMVMMTVTVMPGMTMQSTKFSRGSKEGRGDTSIWTDTPSDKAQKAKMNYLEAYNEATALASNEVEKKRRSSEAELVDKYNEAKRSKSLLQKHQEATDGSRSKRKSKQPAGADKEDWVGKHPWKPWDREKDLTAGRQNVKLNAENMSEGLSSRFSSGSFQRNFL